MPKSWHYMMELCSHICIRRPFWKYNEWSSKKKREQKIRTADTEWFAFALISCCAVSSLKEETYQSKWFSKWDNFPFCVLFHSSGSSIDIICVIVDFVPATFCALVCTNTIMMAKAHNKAHKSGQKERNSNRNSPIFHCCSIKHTHCERSFLHYCNRTQSFWLEITNWIFHWTKREWAKKGSGFTFDELQQIHYCQSDC